MANAKYLKKYTEEERPQDYGKCYDCKLPYSEFECDLVIQNNLWEFISPTKRGRGCGLLCPMCIIKRLRKGLGLSAIHVMVDTQEMWDIYKKLHLKGFRHE